MSDWVTGLCMVVFIAFMYILVMFFVCTRWKNAIRNVFEHNMSCHISVVRLYIYCHPKNGHAQNKFQELGAILHLIDDQYCADSTKKYGKLIERKSCVLVFCKFHS